MTQSEKLQETIRLFKAGQSEAARAVLEPYLQENPHDLEAWIWETTLVEDDAMRVKVLETCLRFNPGNQQITSQLEFMRQQVKTWGPGQSPSTLPAYSPPPPVYPQPGPASYRNSAPIEPSPTVSPFSGSNDWLDDSEDPLTALRPTDAEASFFESPQSLEAQSLFEDSPRPQPGLPQKMASPKNKRMSPQMMKVILAGLACLACLAFSGLYMLGGYYLSGQIDQSFAGQNCAEVVQQAAFASFYPRGIFGAMFTGYDQLIECRIKLDVEQAVAAKNWEASTSLAQQYLATYPNGTFAKDLGEQAPTFFSAWAKELISSRNYASGVEKLKLLVKTYPDSPAAQAAPESILQTYFLWTKGLVDKQNYKDAEFPLKSALTYFQADPVRSEQVKQVLVNLYVVWGDLQTQQGDIDNAVLTYQKAGEVFPGSVDVELLIARANLQKAINISKTKNFDKALAKVQEVLDAAQVENIQAEAQATREEILTAYAFSTSPQAMEQLTAAIPLMCEEQRPELPIFGRDMEKIRFGMTNTLVKLPADWVAERPGELHYVICPTETEQEIETCKYTNGFFLTRVRYLWQVKLYDILTGEVSVKATLKGADPDGCPPRANFLVGSKVSRSYGQRPSADQIVAWLTKLKLTK